MDDVAGNIWAALMVDGGGNPAMRRLLPPEQHLYGDHLAVFREAIEDLKLFARKAGPRTSHWLFFQRHISLCVPELTHSHSSIPHTPSLPDDYLLTR